GRGRSGGAGTERPSSASFPGSRRPSGRSGTERRNRMKRNRSKGAFSLPPRRTCGTMQVHHRLLETHPAFRLRQGLLEHATATRLGAGVPFRTGTVTIPVVVHVVYHAAVENISTAQVTSQIDALNRDYGAKNTDRKKVPSVWKGLVTDTRVQFVLARRDPSGKATDGIHRVKTTRASFSDDDQVKSSKTGGADAWPARKYLNLWVCSLGGGLLGYAQFPGGPAKTDGVVILNRAFGTKGIATAPFNLGRTAVHELAHWLNLRH